MAELRLKGRTVKQKYFTVPEKPRKNPKMSDGLGNIKMMITRLEIKTEKEIALVDIRQQDSPIFVLKLSLPNRSVDMAQIENKPFLARRLYGHRKRVNNMRDKRHLNN